MGILQAEILEWLPCLPSGDLPNSGIDPWSPTLRPRGEPMNTRGGSLSLLQGALFNPGIELGSPALQAESLPLSYQGSHIYIYIYMPTCLFRFPVIFLASLMAQGLRIRLQWRGPTRLRFSPWVGIFPWNRKWQPAPVFLTGKFHLLRSLAGCSPWGPKESDMTEHTHTHITFYRIYIYAYLYSFFYSFPLYFITRYWI